MGVVAGVIDVSSTEPIAWNEVILMGATEQLAQAGVALLAAFLAF